MFFELRYRAADVELAERALEMARMRRDGVMARIEATNSLINFGAHTYEAIDAACVLRRRATEAKDKA